MKLMVLHNEVQYILCSVVICYVSNALCQHCHAYNARMVYGKPLEGILFSRCSHEESKRTLVTFVDNNLPM